jgi:hypothetical protein
MSGGRRNIPVQVGLLAGFGKRSNSLSELGFQLQEVRRRGFGVVYFYYEGLWGDRYPLPERQNVRRQGIADLHRQLLSDGQPVEMEALSPQAVVQYSEGTER